MDRGRSGRTRRAETPWRTAGTRLFASRCKAEGGGKNRGMAVAEGRSRRSRSSIRHVKSRSRWPRQVPTEPKGSREWRRHRHCSRPTEDDTVIGNVRVRYAVATHVIRSTDPLQPSPAPALIMASAVRQSSRTGTRTPHETASHADEHHASSLIGQSRVAGRKEW